MCLILVAFKVEPQFRLVVAANRDEYFIRPTSKAHFWQDHPDIFAGRDLQEQGTWMGITRSGRFAAVTNRSFTRERASSNRSRGELVREFLLSDNKSSEFVREIEHNKFRGCNLIVYDGIDLVYWSNHGNVTAVLDPGCHAITNENLNSNSSRSSFGRNKLEQLESKHDASALLALLGPRDSPQSNECFIVRGNYGTRASTAVILGENKILVCEQQYGPLGRVGSLTHQEIVLDATKRV